MPSSTSSSTEADPSTSSPETTTHTTTNNSSNNISDSSYGSATFPPITVSHISHCAFPAWHATFQHCTLKSRCIPLSEEFIDYLNADGIFLPLDGDGQHPAGYESDDGDEKENGSYVVELPDTEDAEVMMARMGLGDDMERDGVAVVVGEETGHADADEDGEEGPHPAFPDLQRQIEEIIDEMGGAVFPKLNWSSPKDACWVATGSTLKCVSAADVFLLLKSSDFIAHDLGHAFENCVQHNDTSADENGQPRRQPIPARPDQFHLVLRKWYELIPSMEFRCFVRDNVLIGITQRDIANFYDFLVDEGESLHASIERFFSDNIKGRFPDSSFVFDVYINQRNRKVWLLDFNPFSPETDPLLFSWNEILTAHPTPTSADFRIVESQARAVNSAHPAYTMNRLPRDAIDLSNGGSIDEFAERFRRNVYDAV
ncbi:D123-domain-containing protein [Powellomyces hirtus]|nr:D123-domain-containing protein [Powellomyces hirtus]